MQKKQVSANSVQHAMYKQQNKNFVRYEPYAMLEEQRRDAARSDQLAAKQMEM